MRLDADGTGVTTTYEDTWSLGYTHLTPFYLAGGQQHAFVYKSSSGTVRFLRMNSQGSGKTGLATWNWYGGWTHFAPFSIGGHPYFIAYDSLNGYANIERINPEGSGSTTISGETLDERLDADRPVHAVLEAVPLPLQGRQRRGQDHADHRQRQ